MSDVLIVFVKCNGDDETVRAALAQVEKLLAERDGKSSVSKIVVNNSARPLEAPKDGVVESAVESVAQPAAAADVPPPPAAEETFDEMIDGAVMSSLSAPAQEVFRWARGRGGEFNSSQVWNGTGLDQSGAFNAINELLRLKIVTMIKRSWGKSPAIYRLDAAWDPAEKKAMKEVEAKSDRYEARSRFAGSDPLPINPNLIGRR